MDEAMSSKSISKVLWRHDPGNTCCNVNGDMEDEYDGLAAAIASVPVSDLTPETFRSILAESFDDDLLDDSAVIKSYAEILEL